jgi:hypothetical protein
VDPVQLGGEGPPDIGILRIERLLEGLLGLPQRLGFPLVGLDVGGEIGEFFLRGRGRTSTAESRFLRDILCL